MDEAVVQAQERLEVVVTELRDRDVSARGDVGDTNPLLAIADALADFPATEIMIATHPRGESHWLERRLIERARARFDVPITELVSGSGVVQDGIAA
jgi:GABA permease